MAPSRAARASPRRVRGKAEPPREIDRLGNHGIGVVGSWRRALMHSCTHALVQPVYVFFLFFFFLSFSVDGVN